jgi:hypothetical protein
MISVSSRTRRKAGSRKIEAGVPQEVPPTMSTIHSCRRTSSRLLTDVLAVPTLELPKQGLQKDAEGPGRARPVFRHC